ncbi:MAG TPA: response regulator, partial [Desulfobacteraceae bacterium]|nr:response regulator [Desulfobacteraceae bacterium]
MDKVLIVDDNLEFLGILKEGLQHYSGQFEALFASDVNEAVIKLKREDISILVTDLKMPKVDGLAL